MEMEAYAQENGLPGESVAEEGESEDAYGTDSLSAIASIGDIDEAPNILDPIVPSPLNTRSYGKANKTKDRETFYNGYGVVYLPGDINGLAKKLHLLAAEFFAGNTSVKNELVHIFDALLRLKQLTRKEYANIIARLAASL